MQSRAWSISDTSGTALGVHLERLAPRGRFCIRALPQGEHERLNPLTMVELAFSIFVESGSIAIPFGHAARLAGTAPPHCAL